MSLRGVLVKVVVSAQMMMLLENVAWFSAITNPVPLSDWCLINS